jgi:hypothetical protein
MALQAWTILPILSIFHSLVSRLLMPNSMRYFDHDDTLFLRWCQLFLCTFRGSLVGSAIKEALDTPSWHNC